MPSTVVQTWKLHWSFQVIFSAFAVFCFFGATPASDSIATAPVGLGTRLMLTGLSIVLFLIAVRPQVALTADSVRLRRMFGTTIVPLADIVAVAPSQGGLYFELRSGRDTTATFVGGAGLLVQLLGRHTRGDDMAAEIMAAISAPEGRSI